MAEAETKETKTKRPGFAQTLRQGWKPAQRHSSSAGASKATAVTKEAPKEEAPAKAKEAAAKPKEAEKAEQAEQAKETAAKPAGKQTAATKTAAESRAPTPNLQERMDGVQGWMAELERKQGRMTYFGAAAILLALAAAGAAHYFGITTKSDSATKEDLDALEEKVDGLQKAVTKNTESTQQTLNETVTGLQTSIDKLTRQQAANASAISALQTQPKAAAGATAIPPTTTTPATPGVPTTPGGAKQP